MTRWMRLRQLVVATTLVSLPLAGGVAVAHTIDDLGASVQTVRGLEPAEPTGPPGVDLGTQLGAEWKDQRGL